MGRKSREKRERRNPTRPTRPVREGEVRPGVTVRAKGEQVVLRNKMSVSEHAAFVGEVRQAVEGAPAQLESMRDRLLTIIGAVPTAEFLVRVADRFMPHNAETYRESESPGVAIQIEYPTWLSLQLPAPRTGGEITPAQMTEATEILEGMFRLTALRLQFESTIKRKVTEPTAEDEVIGFSKTHELGVRNPGFITHLRNHLEALFTDQGDLLRLTGFTILDLLAVMNAVYLHGNDRYSEPMHAELQRIRPVVRDILRGKADAQLQSLVPLELRRGLTQQQLRAFGAQLHIREAQAKVFVKAEDLATVTPAWLHARSGVPEDTCRRILDQFATPFGQKPIADNLMSRYEPLELRPIVPLTNDRYLPILMHLWHFGARVNLERTLATDKDAFNRYERRRARFLEDRALALFAKMLPGAQIDGRLHYKMANDKGQVQEYELDGLVTYGPTLFLIEGKGGPMSRAALRGASASLRQDLKDLVGEAYRQSRRARAFLETADRVDFLKADGSTREIARAEYPEIYLVSVTLESLDVFLMRLTQLRKMGILGEGDLPWAVSLADLEVIADHIEWGPQLVHYLRRRLRLNREDIAAAEELDFFATYLVDGLAVASELNGETFVQMSTTNTRWMDDYYMHLDGVRQTPAEMMRMRLPAQSREAIAVAATQEPAVSVNQVAALLDEAVARRISSTRSAR